MSRPVWHLPEPELRLDAAVTAAQLAPSRCAWSSAIAVRPPARDNVLALSHTTAEANSGWTPHSGAGSGGAH